MSYRGSHQGFVDSRRCPQTAVAAVAVAVAVAAAVVAAAVAGGSCLGALVVERSESDRVGVMDASCGRG